MVTVHLKRSYCSFLGFYCRLWNFFWSASVNNCFEWKGL